MIDDARKDDQLVDRNWNVLQKPIEGVTIKEVRHVLRDHGVITEMYRPEWDPTGLPVVQTYQSRLYPGAIGAWSCHARSIDRLFVALGHVKAVLYDAREDSPTHGLINELHLGDHRPALVVLPVGIWHGLQNLGPGDALVFNAPSVPYQYEDPDHYRLPWDSPKIPYSWNPVTSSRHRSDSRE